MDEPTRASTTTTTDSGADELTASTEVNELVYGIHALNTDSPDFSQVNYLSF